MQHRKLRAHFPHSGQQPLDPLWITTLIGKAIMPARAGTGDRMRIGAAVRS
jgi:hypothetical protein